MKMKATDIVLFRKPKDGVVETTDLVATAVYGAVVGGIAGIYYGFFRCRAGKSLPFIKE